jgi:hypothetical protein
VHGTVGNAVAGQQRHELMMVVGLSFCLVQREMCVKTQTGER